MPKKDCLELPYSPLREKLRRFCDFILEVKKPKNGYTPGLTGTIQKNKIIAPFLGVGHTSVKNDFLENSTVSIPIQRLDDFKLKFELFLMEVDAKYLIDSLEIRKDYAEWVQQINELKNSHEEGKKREKQTTKKKKEKATDNLEVPIPPPEPDTAIGSVEEIFDRYSEIFSLNIKEGPTFFEIKYKERENIVGSYSLYYIPFFQVKNKRASRLLKAQLSISLDNFGLAHSCLNFTEPQFNAVFKNEFGTFSDKELNIISYGEYTNLNNSQDGRPLIKLKIYFPQYPIQKNQEVLFGEFRIKRGFFPFRWSIKRPIILIDNEAKKFNVSYWTTFAEKYFSKEVGMRPLVKNWIYNIKEIAGDINGDFEFWDK